MNPKQLIELAFKHNLPRTEIVYALAQCARHVLPLTREQDREVCLKAIEAAEKWCREPTEENRKAANIAGAAYAADIADYADYADIAAAIVIADIAAAAQVSSDEEINQIILQNLPKLQRIVNLKVFW